MTNKHQFFLSFLILAFSIALSSCEEEDYNPDVPKEDTASYYEEGLASWYGEAFHGNTTANGEIFNMYELSAAHKTLPFHSIVEVTNKRNQKKIEVRINDRGPFVEGRIIDLSMAAADSLDMINDGIVEVGIKLVSSPESQY